LRASGAIEQLRERDEKKMCVRKSVAVAVAVVLGCASCCVAQTIQPNLVFGTYPDDFETIAASGGDLKVRAKGEERFFGRAVAVMENSTDTKPTRPIAPSPTPLLGHTEPK